MKIDPSGALLTSLVDLNNLALSRFTAEVTDRILEADTPTSWNTASAKIRARVLGTVRAAEILGVR